MNNPRIPIFYLFPLAAGILCLGCGAYSFSGSTLPPHIETVGIPLFEDRTTEFGIDQMLTDTLIEAVTEDNTLEIADPGKADALISGVIVSVKDRAGQYSADESASDYRVFINVKVRFEDVRKRTVLWEDSLTEWGAYETDRSEGIEEALEKLSTEILNRSVSGW